MPELPEVETVKETLKQHLLHRTIKKVDVYYEKMIEYPKVEELKKQLVDKEILYLKRRGKWILFELNDYYLLSHLRMEGKYHFRIPSDPLNQHEHVVFLFDDGSELRYQDTRKFGRMHLIKKDELFSRKPLNELGLEPWDSSLTVSYLKQKLKNKQIPIKTVLLDQSIIVGIGNIYDDEILFMSGIRPTKKASTLTKKELQKIIDCTKIVLEHAISLGGTTIRSYESSEGVHGRFQNELSVHGKEKCPTCQIPLEKIKIGGRTTYYCKKCQK